MTRKPVRKPSAAARPVGSVRPGTIVGPYRILRACRGKGGMAQVFEVEVRRAYHRPGMPRHLALKVAKPEHQTALVAEADYLRLFNHPNVVRIVPLPGMDRPVYAARAEFPFGLGWYYAMEFLDGGSLARTLARTRPLTGALRPPPHRGRRLNIGVIVGIGRQIADALAHIHERHIVNLDVKPANIMFRKRTLAYFRSSVPQAVLGDFGIARDLRYPRAGALGVATLEYTSPEHASETGARLSRVDCRSDVFSLGIVLYEMLTGQMPFSTVALIVDPRYAPQRPRALRAAVPAALDELVMRALAKDAGQRFQTVADLRAALDRVPVPADWPRVGRCVAAAAVAGGLVGGGVYAAPSIRLPERALTPTPGFTPTVVWPSATLVVTPSPAVTPTETPEPGPPAPPTSTLMPTFTPTRTPVPATRTPTAQPGGSP